MFASWLTGITERRRRLGATVTVATTEFTVDFLAQVWPSVADEFTRREDRAEHRPRTHPRLPEPTGRQGRRPGLWQHPRKPRARPGPGAYDIIEWHRENLALITNLPERELPGHAISQERLPHPAARPAAGLIADFLRRWYGPGFRSQLHIVAEVDSIYYGLA